MGLFEVENLIYFYPDKEHPALDNINLQIDDGEFVFFSGVSGCGKSTLLKALAGLLPDYYGGRIGGEIFFGGSSLFFWNKRQLARNIGIIFQDPEEQLVMGTVEQEVAFGLENLGIPRAEMRRRVAEALAMVELGQVKHEQTSLLSGGMQQKTVLASVLAMQPRVLILDEPTSQLDPVAAQELLNYVHRLNQEWGLTIIMVEQRVDRCFHLADRVVIMDSGGIEYEDNPRRIVQNANGYLPFLPPVCRVFGSAGIEGCPLTVKEGRELVRKLRDNTSPIRQVNGGIFENEISKGKTSKDEMVNKSCSENHYAQEHLKPEEIKEDRKAKDNKYETEHSGDKKLNNSYNYNQKREACRDNVEGKKLKKHDESDYSSKSMRSPLLETKNLFYAYSGRDFCVQDVSLQLCPGEVTVVLGENGAGKSTLLKVLCGLLSPRRGRVLVKGEDISRRPVEDVSRDVGFLSQNPNDYLFNDTVYQEVEYGLKVRKLDKRWDDEINIDVGSRVEEVLRYLRLQDHRDENPRDLSGGERQRVALGTVLATDPDVLLLDEPTRGLDISLKWELADLIKEFASWGKAVMLVTHDVEFAVRVAQKVLIISGGELVSSGGLKEVLSNSLYYTPQVNKIFRGLVPEEVMTPEEAVNVLKSFRDLPAEE